MRRLSLVFISAVSTIAFTQIASSADLGPIYGRPPPPMGFYGHPLLPVGFSSPGWYVGLNAGYGWGNSNGIDNSIISTFCDPSINQCDPNQLSSATATAVPLNFDTHPKGFIGGGQIGYNFPTGALVWGIEADFQGADIRGDANVANTAGVPDFSPNTVTVAGTASQKLDFLGTLRGRLGWTPTPPWLFYVTGGLAYGHVKTDVSFSEHIAFCVCGPDGFTSVSNDEWRAGWTVGGGLEWMFAPRWSIKGEYLYYDLGHVTLNKVLSQEVTPVFTDVGISSEARYRGSIARAGVNYHF